MKLEKFCQSKTSLLVLRHSNPGRNHSCWLVSTSIAQLNGIKRTWWAFMAQMRKVVIDNMFCRIYSTVATPQYLVRCNMYGTIRSCLLVVVLFEQPCTVQLESRKILFKHVGIKLLSEFLFKLLRLHTWHRLYSIIWCLPNCSVSLDGHLVSLGPEIQIGFSSY